MVMNNNATADLLSISSAPEWISWLFNLQCNLIETGYVEGLTETGRGDFAARMQGLHDHFSEMQRVTKE